METEIENGDSAEIEVELGDPTVGDCLRAERERQGISEKQAADLLHITMHYVRAIESDSYEKLPGIVFARGYIKSYGLLLGLDNEDLIERFDAMVAERSGEARNQVESERRNERQGQLIVWSLIALAAFVLGYLVVWAYFKFSDAGQNGVVAASETRDQAPLSVIQSEFDVAILRGEVLRSPLSLSNSQPKATDIAQSEAVTRRIRGSLRSELKVLPGRLARERDGGQFTEVITLGTDLLQVTFVDSGWIEIGGAVNEPIYRNIHRPGDVLQVTGRAPFDVLLGDAGSASIKLNQLNVPVVDDIRIDNTARLLVGL